jgi:hypothetical protein
MEHSAELLTSGSLSANVCVYQVQNCARMAKEEYLKEKCHLAVTTFHFQEHQQEHEIYSQCLEAVRISHIKANLGYAALAITN